MNKRARINDIARMTGLSRSTVDRVINRRPGVRPETRDVVERVLNKLGYVANSLEALPRASSTRIEVHLSRGSNPFFQEIWNGLQAAADQAANLGTSISFRGFDPYAPETLVANLANISHDVDCAVVLGVDSPGATQAIDHLVERGIRVVTMISDTPMSRRSVFVGQENFQAGSAAGRLMSGFLGPQKGQIAVLIGHLEFRHLLDRRAGFEQFIGLNCPGLSVVSLPPYGSNPETSRSLMDDLQRHCDQLVGIYLCGGGQPALFDVIAKAGNDVRVIAHEVTSHTRAALLTGQLDAIVAHDMLEFGHEVFQAATDPTATGFRPCGINIYVPENLPPQSGP